jgi:hypothetical protein
MDPFSKILDMCRLYTSSLTDVVFIGGVAVYLHLIHRPLPDIEPDTSHDADFMVSFRDYGTLKDMVEITYNPYLAKHQMIDGGVELDMYVEHLNRLIVPYDEVFAHAIELDQTRVACLEHLFVLKLDAFRDRRESSKGEKDCRNIAAIGLLLGRKARRSLIEPYMSDEFFALLKDIAKSPAFFEIHSHNAHAAKKTKTSFASFVSSIS